MFGKFNIVPDFQGHGKKDWGMLAIDYNRVNCIVNLTSYQIFKDSHSHFFRIQM